MGIANTCQEYTKPRDEVRCRAERFFSREHQNWTDSSLSGFQECMGDMVLMW